MNYLNSKIENQKEIIKKKLARNITLDYMYSFICNLNMSNSIWVLYLAFKGMSLFQIGLLEGIFHITAMLTEIPSGALADLFGRKKSLLIGRVFLTLSCVIMMFSNHFIGFALGFIFHAWSYNFNSGSEEALVYDSLKQIGKEDTYPKINGRINFVIEVAQGISTVTGGILAEISYGWCYFTCIVIAVFCFLPLFIMTEPPLKSVKQSKSLRVLIACHFKTCWNILKADKRILDIVAYYSIIFTAYTVLLFMGQQFFQDHGLNKVEISVIMLFAGLAACGGALCSEKLVRLMGKKMAIMGACGIAIAIITFGINNLYLAAGALVIASFFNSILYPAQSAELNVLIPSEQRATIISLNSTVFSVLMVLVFPLVGGLADIWNLPLVFSGLGIVMLLGIALHRISR